MAQWVKKRIRLPTLMGVVKDQLSTGRVIAKNGQLTQIDLAVLRATNHEEQAIQEEAVRSVLEIGTGSRMRVSHCIRVLMERLDKTSSWVVTLKCLIVVHRCLQEGGFMFQDQLSVHPANGGHNYLNLSKFRDKTSPFTWAVSGWVRWYARFIEQWIQMARITGSFADIKVGNKTADTEKISSLSSEQLVRDINSLHDLLHEASTWQEEDYVMTHALVKEGLRLVVLSALSAYQEIKPRLYEMQERIATLERSEVLSLLHICDKMSLESMTFTHLFESVKDWPSLHDHVALEQVIFTDYDLMSLKQSFRVASQNISSSPKRLGVNGHSALQWRSGSWMNSTKASEEATRGRSLSDVTFLNTYA